MSYRESAYKILLEGGKEKIEKRKEYTKAAGKGAAAGGAIYGGAKAISIPGGIAYDSYQHARGDRVAGRPRVTGKKIRSIRGKPLPRLKSVKYAAKKLGPGLRDYYNDARGDAKILWKHYGFGGLKEFVRPKTVAKAALATGAGAGVSLARKALHERKKKKS
jgi:hypothetical protein